MSTEAVSLSAFLYALEQLRLVREIVRIAGQAQLSLSDCLVDELYQAVDAPSYCRGQHGSLPLCAQPVWSSRELQPRRLQPARAASFSSRPGHPQRSRANGA